ncbi:MAG: PD-(D/E)XK nuclease family protein, partial [Solirubrobacteraceae bacterium]
SAFPELLGVCADGLWVRRRRWLLADVVGEPELAPTDRERERARAAARAPLTGDEPEPRRVLSAVALAHVRHARIVSAGALENYSDCPVRWLVEGQLSPAPMTPDPEPLVRGSLIHAVLERLISDLDGPITPTSLPAAQSMLEGLIAELSETVAGQLGVGEPDVVRAGALCAVEADLRRYLEHEAAGGREWKPFGLELRFGFDQEGSLPALTLGNGSPAVLVRGVIDRVDVDGDGHALVRDYKSGARRADQPVARWNVDRRLQVALYMLVARELLGLDVVAGIYQPLRGDDLRARGVFVKGSELGAGVHDRDARAPEEVDAELADAAARAIELAARLRSGELTPCPSTCSRDGCAYPSICRSR